jgi:hypothetical protein
VTTIFEGFDFNLLSSPDFKEDAVREELISPILKELGYSASGENRIIRSKSLKHPFVYIGTRHHRIHIIPDYLLQVKKENKWILDAKSPKEEINSGPNVEQAYSYAIHPDIRTELYALCNGHKFVLFHVSKINPILDMRLVEIKERWGELNKTLSPIAINKPHLIDYKPDFGLRLLKLRMNPQTVSHFPLVPIPLIGRVDDETYCTTIVMGFGDESYAITFDFDRERLQELINIAPEGQKGQITEELRKYPFQVTFQEPFYATIEAEFGSNIQGNEDEDFLPFVVRKFS